MMKYLKSHEIASIWNVSERTVRNYCQNRLIIDAKKEGKTWLIPSNAKRPVFSDNKRTLINVLIDQKNNCIKGGIYNKLQIDFAYNSNHIEGSKLTHDETRYIYETKTIGAKTHNVDDVIEVVNHFACFDYIIETYKKELSSNYIKNIHLKLKTSTFSSKSKEAVVGDYKKYANYVNDIETSNPKNVEKDINKLLEKYNKKDLHTIEDIVKFHSDFEKIHPFYDGNGRVGRLIMFKECLKNNIVPFIIDDKFKYEYYNGLNKYQKNKEITYLLETCLLMQDNMKLQLDYFEIKY